MHFLVQIFGYGIEQKSILKLVTLKGLKKHKKSQRIKKREMMTYIWSNHMLKHFFGKLSGGRVNSVTHRKVKNSLKKMELERQTQIYQLTFHHLSFTTLPLLNEPLRQCFPVRFLPDRTGVLAYSDRVELTKKALA